MTQHFSWQAALLEDPDLASTTKLVALVIGTHMNQHGTGAWPSIATIAAHASLNPEVTRRHISTLRKAGWIRTTTRERADRGTTSNEYAIAWPGEEPPPTQSEGGPPTESAGAPPTQSGGAPPTQSPPPRRTPPSTTPATTDSPEGESPDARALAEHLADRIAERGGKRPTVTATWVRDMDRLLRLDGRPTDEVRRVIDWLHRARDPVAAFWQPNVRSPATLRTRWDQMAEQYRARRPGSPSGDRGSTTDAVAQYLEQEPTE